MNRNKLYILLTIVITLCLQLACSSSEAIEPPAAKASPEAIAITIGEADLLFRQRDDIAKLRSATDLLARFRNPDARDFEIEWKFAKYSYFLGKQSKDPKEVELVLAKGRDAGKIASTLEPTKPDGYFWYGANLGELCRLSPLTVGIKSIDDVQAAMNKVIEIKPDYQNSSAFDALAQVEMESRSLGGSASKAVEILEKVVKTEKSNGAIRLHLAEAYLAVNRKGDARSQIDAIIQMTPDPNYVPEHRETLEKAKKMLETKF
ncbi:hypothetical protein BH10ACI2_BH10ACI2_20290 [soil metagenome]